MNILGGAVVGAWLVATLEVVFHQNHKTSTATAWACYVGSVALGVWAMLS